MSDPLWCVAQLSTPGRTTSGACEVTFPIPADLVAPAQRFGPGQGQRRRQTQPQWPARLPLPRPARPPGHPRPADHHLRRPGDREAHYPDPHPAPRLRTPRRPRAADHRV